MRIGKLDRRATLQRRAQTGRDAQGGPVFTYTDYATVWAEKLDLRGREFYAANQEHGEVTTKIRIRHRSDLSMTDKVVCEGVEYNIVAIADVGRREISEIICEAVRG